MATKKPKKRLPGTTGERRVLPGVSRSGLAGATPRSFEGKHPRKGNGQFKKK